MSEEDLKIYDIDEGEFWYAAKTKKEAIEEHVLESGDSPDDFIFSVKELSDSELEQLRYYDDWDGSEECEENSVSFKHRLDELIKKGISKPVLFAINIANL